MPFGRLDTGSIDLLFFALLAVIAKSKNKQSVIFAIKESEIAPPPLTLPLYAGRSGVDPDLPPKLRPSRNRRPMVIYGCRCGLRDRLARGMRPRGIATGAPGGDPMRAWARLRNSVSSRSSLHILPLKPSSETFHKAVSHEAMSHVGLPGPMPRHSTPRPAHRFEVSPDVGWVPLLRKAILRIAFRSLPRRSISATVPAPRIGPRWTCRVSMQDIRGYPSEAAALTVIAGKLGCSPVSLRV